MSLFTISFSGNAHADVFARLRGRSSAVHPCKTRARAWCVPHSILLGALANQSSHFFRGCPRAVLRSGTELALGVIGGVAVLAGLVLGFLFYMVRTPFVTPLPLVPRAIQSTPTQRCLLVYAGVVPPYTRAQRVRVRVAWCVPHSFLLEALAR